MRGYAFKLTDIDGETSHEFVWPMTEGAKVVASGPFTVSDNPCPSMEGDGLCLALTWQGAQSGGQQARCMLIVSYDTDDVLAESVDKLRVKQCRVESGPIDVHKAIRRGEKWWANLTWANLTRADLTGANLTGANLTRADLYGANLTGANLTGANLTWANLTRADLYGANLTGANLTGANLTGANLTGADLTGANLTGADLTGANLTWANLTGANLTGANLTGANLTGADLTGANLSGAINVPEYVKRSA